MMRYESTFDDYLELIIQFGYIMIFSSTFPLAAVCALINNIIEIRSDAFKICVVHQRPFGGHLVRDIGLWEDIMNAMVYMAIIVNCALIAKNKQISKIVGIEDDVQLVIISVVIEVWLTSSKSELMKYFLLFQHLLIALKWMSPLIFWTSFDLISNRLSMQTNSIKYLISTLIRFMSKFCSKFVIIFNSFYFSFDISLNNSFVRRETDRYIESWHRLSKQFSCYTISHIILR